MYRFGELQKQLEILLVHPGGPFWQKKDIGAWMIPKGLVENGEDLLKTAVREFSEETGITPQEPFMSLGEIKHKSGKVVHAWAFCGNCDIAKIQSNMFEMEWPPKSGQVKRFPEIDKGEFFDLPSAKNKMLPAEVPFLDRLAEKFPQETNAHASEAGQALLGI
jgi:predicted NUDIX family NTP pyrophosphohydrolase